MTDQDMGVQFDLSKLPGTDINKALSIVNSIDIANSNAVIMYGAGARMKIENFTETILDQVRAGDAGYLREILSDLFVYVKDLSIDLPGTGVSAIPIIGRIINPMRKFVTKCEGLSVHIERTISELETARTGLLRDLTVLEKLYSKDLGYLKELDLYILAGEIKVKELRVALIPGLRMKAEASNDPADAGKLQEMHRLALRFETKLHDLEVSRTMAIRTAAQLKNIRENDQALVEKIQNAILNAVPLWKSRLTGVVTLFRNAASPVKQVTGEIEILKDVNADLITAVEETLTLQAEVEAKRIAAEEEFQRIESGLGERLRRIS